MSLSITQKEINAVLGVLRDEFYEDEKQAAKAVIEVFLRERDKRDQWCLVGSYAGFLSAVGPYPTIAAVKRAVDGGKVTVAERVYIGRLRSHDEAQAHVAEVDAPHPRSAAADEAAKGRRA